jgi:hypothetical protein
MVRAAFQSPAYVVAYPAVSYRPCTSLCVSEDRQERMTRQGLRRYWLPGAPVTAIIAILSFGYAGAQDLSLSATRPTIANSAALQSKGVLQVETGYDAYPQSVPGNQQTVDTLWTYAPFARLRLDFEWSACGRFPSPSSAAGANGSTP